LQEINQKQNTEPAYAAAIILGLLALVTLVLKEILERKTGIKPVGDR